ncbi:MAG: NDP-hexose 2,3-dehydratase family protein [Candidatus Fimivivens sp.]
MQNIIEQLTRSWATEESAVTPTNKILKWIEQKNQETHVEIRKIPMGDMNGWFYAREEGVLRNQQGSFFKITGCRVYEADRVVEEQPIILQPENGYLGIICKEFDGVLHFLMQAKIEPGNLNKIQISPTIQATKSNFTQAHGGKRPAYVDYFLNAKRYDIILDQMQSEQSSRFLKKRNRNLLIRVKEEVEVLPTHRWMTLGQIKALMCGYDNLVNMDTRTVLSGIPFSAVTLDEDSRGRMRPYFSDPSLYRSIFEGNGRYEVPKIYNYINNYKMFNQHRYELVKLHELADWKMDKLGVSPLKPGGFQVIYCQIEIEGREVRSWSQPLFEATGISTFGLICCDIDGVRHFLVRAIPEIGSFDGIELGPSIQIDAAVPHEGHAMIERFLDSTEAQTLCDVLLSEEGGRFYHEQNRNVLLLVQREQLGVLPDGYFLLDYMTLNRLCQINNCLNIQLRNLLSLVRITL